MLFTGTNVRMNIATVDFATMYPTLIMDGGIPPECIDFIDCESHDKPMFDHTHILSTYMYHLSLNSVCIRSVVLGVHKSKGDDVHRIALIAEYSAVVECDQGDMNITAPKSTPRQLLEQTHEGDLTLWCLEYRITLKLHT